LAFTSWSADELLDSKAQTFILDNGMKVVLEENRRTDQVALHIHYGVGSRDERDGERGLAHLFEHLMFEGSAHVPGASFDEWLTSGGGSNNAYTSEDETAYHEVFPAGALDLTLFLESDRLGYLQPGLTDENLANQQQVVLQERARGYNEPNGRDWDALSRLLFTKGHPYHVPVIGTISDIENVKLKGVKSFFTRHYRPDNAVLGMVGNFETEQALARIQHWFSDVPSLPAEAERVTEVARPRTPAQGVLHDAQVEDSTLYLAWRTVPTGHEDDAALSVARWILSGGRGTRLDDALYYKREVVDDNGVFFYTGDIDGLFLVYATLSEPKLARPKRLIRKVLDKVSRKPPSEAELKRAKRSIRNRVLASLETPRDRAGTLVECTRLFGTPDCVREQMRQVDAVTAEQVVQVMERWLTPEHMVQLAVVPEGIEVPESTEVELP
jgi:predicted Zn-dependent peptidase